LKITKPYLAILILAVLGIGVAGYLTWYEMVVPVGVCPINVAYISCSAALTSQYSRIDGISVASLGLAWFLGAFLLGILAAENRTYLNLLLAWSLIAIAGVVALFLIEVLFLDEICPLCSSAHVLGVGISAIAIKLWMKNRKSKT
jgi:uncharacterized membrane protein